MEQSQLNLGNSPMHANSRDRTPANLINGRVNDLFDSLGAEAKMEDAHSEGDIGSRRAGKRPAQTNDEGSASKRQRTEGGISGGGRDAGQADGGPAEIIDLEDDEIPNPGPPVSPRPQRQQPAQRTRSASSQQPPPAPSVDLTSDEGVTVFQIQDEEVQTLTISETFKYIKGRMEKVFKRRAKGVLSDSLESTLEVTAAAISNPNSTKAFIMKTYQTTWKSKLQDSVKCRQDQYKKAVRLQDQHDWQADADKYGQVFVEPKLKLYEAAKKDFQIVEELIEVLEGL